jgi:hypothetical protein
MHPSGQTLRPLFAFVCALIVISQLEAQAPLKESPFLPPANAAAPAGKADTAYELTGMSVAGKATLLSITRVRDKRSTWVAVGQTNGEITAVNYDPKTDQATIRAEGQLLTLSLKKSAAVVNAPNAIFQSPFPTPAPARANPTPVVTPLPATTQEEKETEARMLVTDLLEIGQAQRRAYEEAQRQAAAKGPKPAVPPAKPSK